MVRFLLVAGIFAVADFLELRRAREAQDTAVYLVFMVAVVGAGVLYAI